MTSKRRLRFYGTAALPLAIFGGPLLGPVVGAIGSLIPLGEGAGQMTPLDWAVGHLPAVEVAVRDFARRGVSSNLSAIILVGHITVEIAYAIFVVVGLSGLAITRRMRQPDEEGEAWAKATTSLWYLPCYGVLVLFFILVLHDLTIVGNLYQYFFSFERVRYGWLLGYLVVSFGGLAALNLAYLWGVAGIWSTLIVSYDRIREWLRAKNAVN